MKKLMVIKSIEAWEKIGENPLLWNVNWNKIISFTGIKTDMQVISKRMQKYKKIDEFELSFLKEKLVVGSNSTQ